MFNPSFWPHFTLDDSQISGRKKAALQSQIFVVTATYRRTQSELNALIVEVLIYYPSYHFSIIIPGVMYGTSCAVAELNFYLILASHFDTK